MNNINNHYGNAFDLLFIPDPNIGTLFKSTDLLIKVDKCHYTSELLIECIDNNHHEPGVDENTSAFYKANFTDLNDFLTSQDYTEIINEAPNIDSAIDNLYQILFAGFDLHVTKARVRNDNHQLWSNSRLTKVKNWKNRLHKRIKVAYRDGEESSFDQLPSEYYGDKIGIRSPGKFPLSKLEVKSQTILKIRSTKKRQKLVTVNNVIQ